MIICQIFCLHVCIRVVQLVDPKNCGHDLHTVRFFLIFFTPQFFGFRGQYHCKLFRKSSTVGKRIHKFPQPFSCVTTRARSLFYIRRNNIEYADGFRDCISSSASMMLYQNVIIPAMYSCSVCISCSVMFSG